MRRCSPDKPSIAVLAFDNISGDPDQEYFADGVTEEIITRLSKIRWFFVIARNSAFTFRGHPVKVQDVARELGIQYVLEGSVRKAGIKVRVTAQLIDALTGNHIWAERYDRDLNDIFAVQDEITQQIAAAVEPELANLERQRARTVREQDLNAWDHVWRGWWHFYCFTEVDNAQAINEFQMAIKTSSDLASAYTGIAQCKLIQIWFDWTEEKEANLDEARRAVETAISLDYQDADAHAQRSVVAIYSGEHDDGLAEGKIAVELNQSFANGHNVLGFAQLFSSYPEEAILSFKQALRLSPFDPFKANFLVGLGFAQRISGQFEDALVAAKEAIRLKPDWPQLYRALAVNLTSLGRTDEAARAREEAMRLDPGYSILGRQRWRPPFRDSSHFERHIEGLKKAGFPE